ncbi:MAG: prephenate dehydratase [Pseudomonadota bacterium]|nr:prephenate dehydratase [Pseudomonadota bacterium]
MKKTSRSKALQKLRNQIDQIDVKSLNLLNKRAAIAKKIAQVKSDSNNKNIFRPERESQIIRDIIKLNKGPLTNSSLEIIYKEIISSCLSLETNINVSYLGPTGSFSNLALKKFFGSMVSPVCRDSIIDIFNDVISNTVNYGVVPIENSNQGSISQTLELLIDKSIMICGEINLDVKHFLLSKLKNISSISEIYAHEQTFLQCKDWIDKNLRNCKRIIVSSNSEAAKKARLKKNSAAIASENCADEYKLHVLKKNIQDFSNNVTRFIIIGNDTVGISKDDKTSIVVSASNKPGSLYSLLQPLSKNSISMTKIESVPTKRKNWEYMFFLDIDGHSEEPKIKKALNSIKRRSTFYKNLGSYPKSI